VIGRFRVQVADLERLGRLRDVRRAARIDAAGEGVVHVVGERQRVVEVLGDQDR
jgi:hypothetical protein